MQAKQSVLGDLKKVDACLSQFDQLTVTQFCKKCDSLAASQAGAARGAPARPTVNQNAVASYVERLSSAGGDQAQFEGVLAEMKADKSLRLAEIGAIAQAFVGGTSKYSKKADAFKDISLRFDAHISGKQRLSAASDIF